MAKKKLAKQKENTDKWGREIPSPIAAYPGYVSLPAHFTMAHFRQWRAVNDRLMEIEDSGGVGVVGSFNGGSEFASFDPRQWAHVLAVADLHLDNLPPDALIDESGESTPLEVLGWLIPLVVGEYLPEKLNLKN